MTEIQEFEKKGYLKLKKFLDIEEVSQVLKEAKNIFLRQFIAKHYIQNVPLEGLSEKEFNSLMYRLYDDDIHCLINCGKQAQHLISLHQLSLNNKVCKLLNKLGLKKSNYKYKTCFVF